MRLCGIVDFCSLLIMLYYVLLFTDDQRSLNTQRSFYLTYKLAIDCYNALNRLTGSYKVYLWVPVHGIEGNEKADELARNRTRICGTLSKEQPLENASMTITRNCGTKIPSRRHAKES